MSVRALQARIDCTRSELEALWRTHVVFNQRLPAILSTLFRMRRGEAGDTEDEHTLYRQIADFVLARNAKDAPYLMHSVSIPNWNPNTAKKQPAKVRAADGTVVEVFGSAWADAAAELTRQGKLLYDKHQVLGDVPDTLRQVVVRECVAIISSYIGLVARWEEEHAAWIEKKQKWEAEPEHQLYLALRPRFETFEASAGGKAGKRRDRWHLYIKWLYENPELAAWRGGVTAVHDLTAEAQHRIKRARKSKRQTVEAEEFFKANPELAALNKLHGYYEREFVRARKTKKNADGFEHRPTFTLPDPIRHPRWFVFNAPQTSPQGYGDLVLAPEPEAFGSISLRLLTGEKVGGEYPNGWVKLRFTADPRLSDFRAVKQKVVIVKGARKGEESEKDAFVFCDRNLRIERPAQISGAKLMFRDIRLNADGSLKSAAPYLVFTCDVEDEGVSEAAKAVKWVEAGEAKRKKVVAPAGVVTCAVDLGIRHIGFATLASKTEAGGIAVLRSRNIWMAHEETKGRHPGRWCEGPDLAQIGDHKRELRALRRERGKPVKGEESHVALQRHVTHMAEDRYKKSAHSIIDFALNVDRKLSNKTGEPFPRADVLLIENLENLIPDAERERGVNKALVAFNRGHLVDRLKEVAKDVGLKLIPISPVGTSQVCSRCGALGRRYSIRRDREQGGPVIHFGPVEKLFACPACGYRANSDHNASVNLHRRFYLGEAAIKGFREYQALSEKQRRERLAEMEAALRPQLIALHELEDLAVPF